MHDGLGLFDRPADDKALRSLLNPLAIPRPDRVLNGVEPGGVADAPFPIKEGQAPGGGKTRTTPVGTGRSFPCS